MFDFFSPINSPKKDKVVFFIPELQTGEVGCGREETVNCEQGQLMLYPRASFS